MKVSVVIPTHNRPDKLRATIDRLRAQSFAKDAFEIIVVDDGSTPPVVFEEDYMVSPRIKLVRLEGAERSVARNTGAREAEGELLVFVDDDVAVSDGFLDAHWKMHLEFSYALTIGAIMLPEDSRNTPFGRFRQNLEDEGTPCVRGHVEEKDFCTAQNMGISKEAFFRLGGFDEKIISSEDQDFGLRFTESGGTIVFEPEALGVHCDNALDIRSYCRRSEWGSRLMLPFYERYPGLPHNVERERINGLMKLGSEPLSSSFRKLLKQLISSRLAVGFLFKVADVLEVSAPTSKVLNKVYRLLLGAHIFRGYRAAKRLQSF